MNKARTFVLSLPLLFCVACTGEVVEEKAEGGATEFANALCPMMGNPVSEGESFDFRGHEIGFCCGGCKPKFAALSEPEQIAKLAEAGFKLPQ